MKKLCSLLFALVFLLSALPVFATADQPPDITLTPQVQISGNTVFSGKAGDSIPISIEVMNVGNIDAVDVIGNLMPEKATVFPEGSSTSTIPVLRSGRYWGRGESGTLRFRVGIDKSADQDVHRLTLKLSYRSADPSDPKVYTASETIMIRVDASQKTMLLSTEKVDVLPSNTLDPGQDFILGFKVANVGDEIAKDIKVVIEGFKEDSFTILEGLNTKDILTLEPDEQQYVSFPMRVNSRCKAGTYELKYILRYKGRKGEAIENTSSLFITVRSGADTASNLVIEELNAPSKTLYPGQAATVSFAVRNQGQSVAKNIIVKAESQDQAGLASKTVSTIKLNELAPAETQTLNFEFVVTPTAETKNYPVNITVEYQNDYAAEGKSTVTQFVGMFVQGKNKPDKEGNKSVPKLIIDRYEFTPKLVMAGGEFDMLLSFHNTSKKTIQNIKVSLVSESGSTDSSRPSASSSVFTPVDGSNTIYIDSIPPKGKVEKNLKLFTIPDASPKTHTVTVNFEYEDAEANQYTSKEQVGVPVIQESKLEVGDISYAKDMMPGMENSVSVPLFNTGKVTLYNMMCKIEGENVSGYNLQYYIGNFSSGSSENFDGGFIINEPGTYKVDVVFSYEDSAGKPQEVRKPLEVTVSDGGGRPGGPGGFPGMPDGLGQMDNMEFPDMNFPGMDAEPQSGGIKKWIKDWRFWAGVAVVVLLIVFIIRRILKKKKEKELEIDA